MHTMHGLSGPPNQWCTTCTTRRLPARSLPAAREARSATPPYPAPAPRFATLRLSSSVVSSHPASSIAVGGSS